MGLYEGCGFMVTGLLVLMSRAGVPYNAFLNANISSFNLPIYDIVI